MHDKLYEQQNDWSNATTENRTAFYTGYATSVGVKDVSKFKTDLDSKSVNDKINFDLSLGRKNDVTGTPTILLNGKKIESDVWSDKAKFKTEIENALK